MSTSAVKRLSVDEYLALERASDLKHEYYDGEMFAMAGAKEAHNLIVANLVGELRNALKSRRCRVYPSDMRVLCPTGLRTYPDVSVVYGDSEFEDDNRETLLNPLSIIEVLSPSTEAYDRGRKFHHYQTIESLQEYVLVALDRPQVDHFIRQPNGGQWLLTTVDDVQAAIALTAIDCRVPLAEVYANVAFEPEGGQAAL
jgi:Uma2 family endonuclease